MVILLIPRYCRVQEALLMAKIQKSETTLKHLVKSAIIEIIEENEALVSRILEEAIEEAFLSHAIKEGKRSRKISRQKVFQTIAQLTK